MKELNMTVERALSLSTELNTARIGGVWGLITGNIQNQSDLVALLNLKESTANRQTSIPANADDAHYPTSKAVKDYADSHGGPSVYVKSAAVSQDGNTLTLVNQNDTNIQFAPQTGLACFSIVNGEVCIVYEEPLPNTYQKLSYITSYGGEKITVDGVDYATSGNTYRFQIGSTHDLEPCYRKADGVIGMYDYVTMTFYTNSGSGAFGLGLILDSAYRATYRQLEYMQFTGTQKIDLGLIPSNHATNVKYAVSKYVNDSHLFGTELAAVYYHFTAFNNKYYWGHNGFEASGGAWSAGMHNLSFNDGSNNAIILDGTTLASGHVSSAPANLLLGSRSGNTNFQGKYYTVNIIGKSDTRSVRYLIPSKRISDNVVGGWDAVNNVFYTNIGSGNIIPGPILS